MSIHTGRMSRRDCAAALTSAGITARSLGNVYLTSRVEHLSDLLNAGTQPAAADVRELVASVNEQAWLRLKASSAMAPSFAHAVTVTLYGADVTTDRAFLLAAESLSCDPADLTLVDRTPVSTPDYVGIRYTLREV